MKRTISKVAASVVLVGGTGAWGTGSASASVIAQDNFNRADSLTIGTMSDGSNSWSQRDDPSSYLEQINNQQLKLYYSSGVQAQPGVAVNGVSVADGVIDVAIPVAGGPAESGRYFGVTYRASTLDDGANLISSGAYHVYINTDWSTSADLNLAYGTTILASADLGASLAGAVPLTLEVTFNGNQHVVSVNGVNKITYTETTSGRTGAGYVGLGDSWTSGATFDDFTLSTVPEPATLSIELMLLSGMALRRRR